MEIITFFFVTDSPYRIAISGSVLKMQESGKLGELKDRWWKNQEAPCGVSFSYYFTIQQLSVRFSGT